MNQYYVSSLVVNESGKSNKVDKIEAVDRFEVTQILKLKYQALGYTIVKQRILLLIAGGKAERDVA